MTPKSSRAALAAAGVLLSTLPAFAEPSLLRTSAALDEPRGYCIDIRGVDRTLELDGPLQGHTCKTRDQEDMLIDDRRVAQENRLYMTDFDLCIAADAPESGADLVLEPCSDGALQTWSHSGTGNLVLTTEPDLCVTLGAEARMNAGGGTCVGVWLSPLAKPRRWTGKRGSSLGGPTDRVCPHFGILGKA